MGKKAEFIAVVTRRAEDSCVTECSYKGKNVLIGIPFKAEIGTRVKITIAVEELDKNKSV